MVHAVTHWLSSSLNRRLTAGLLAALAVSCLALSAISLHLGRTSMRHEQELAATRLIATFEASLYNAMLQRDLPGLQHIVDTLGQANGITQVRLLNRDGQVRFASDPATIGTTATGLCGQRPCHLPSAQTATWREEPASAPSLEVSHRIANQVRCVQCHGAPDAHPINGVLVINFRADTPTTFWLQPELALAGVGLLGLALFGGLMAWTLRRHVTRPLSDMARVSDQIAQGDFSQQFPVERNDEIGRVGRQLNIMANKLQTQVTGLEKQQRFLQDLLDAMPDPVLVIGPDWRIRLANKAYGELIGRPLEDIHLRCCHQVSKGLDQPCPSTLVSCPVLENQTGAGGSRTIMSLRHSDGRDIPVEIDATAVELDGQRMTVEVLRPLERTIRFSQEQRLSAIGLLANGVAHEIHNPLASIRLALQASLRGIRKGNLATDDLVAYLKLVDTEIDRCVLSTQRLMQMSMPPDGQLLPVRLHDAVEDVVSLIKEDARTRKVELITHIAPASLAVLADEAELRQVFVNLIQNAMNALPGGGQVTITAEDTGRGGVRIRVADTGAGIAPDNLSRIFLPFFSRRVDGSRGMGLGLAVCKTTVERFGGTIEAGNQPNSGAVLTLTLRHARCDI